MNETISFKRLAPSTISGEQIAITYVYSSFDKSEIDKIEEYLRDSLGTCLTVGDAVLGEPFWMEQKHDSKNYPCYLDYPLREEQENE